MNNEKYCVYHTIYCGDKFPPNYIGSSTVGNVLSGYHGTIKSKKYSDIWKQELKENPDLFSTVIISYHCTRSDALWKELQIQKIFNVVKNPLFVNLAYASPNGFFGRDVSGENNPMFGKGYKIDLARELGKYKNVSLKCSISANKQWSNTMIRSVMVSNMKKPKMEKVCPYCNLIGRGGNMKRYHFDNCTEKFV